MLTLPQLRGYVLEEALARLVQGSGYSLLVEPSQDPDGLLRGPHGLLVRGRGSNHQADVLGQLTWVPAFSLPVRLFVEAKFLSKRVGLTVVRNAHGVIYDVNQYFRSDGAAQPAMQRHVYKYALFSASGFSADAANYALAHQISLVDLSGATFAPLLDLVRRVAQRMHDELVGQGVNYVRRGDLRDEIRLHLGTWTSSREARPFEKREWISLQLRDPVEELANRINTDFGQFFLGSPEAPFVLVLKANQPESFVASLTINPVQKVNITWNMLDGQSGWTITPVQAPDSYALHFDLPEALELWIFNPESRRDWSEMALGFKASALSTITVFARQGQSSVIGRLLYEPGFISRRQ